MSAREPDHTTRPGAARRLRLLLLALVTVAPMALGWAGSATAAGVLPTPTSITVEAFTDPAFLDAQLGNVPATSVPGVLAGPGDSFQVRVSLFEGTAEAAYRSDQVVSLRATGPGVLTPVTAAMPASVSSAVFTVAYSAASPDVRVTATIGKGTRSLTATSASFRVESVLRYLGGQDASLKDGSAGSDGAGCAVVDRANPVCARIVLPAGATGGVALSLGACPATDPCRRGGTVTQLIADLDQTVYTRQSPARMVLICDKSLCGSGGVSSVVPLWSQDASGAMAPVEACTSKNVIDEALDYCADYVSSKRDGAGDTFLHVLFFKDVRGSI
jgi:hypothetical protein